MLDLKSFQIALLAWGCIFCLILYFVMIFNVALEKKKRHILGSLLLFSALYLATDCLAWYFRGMPGTAGYYGVRLSNGINFISDYLLIGSFHALVCYSLFNDDTKVYHKLIRGKLVVAIEIIGIAIVIINHFNGMLYYFDDANFYHRGLYSLIYAISCLLIVLIDFTLLVQYRKNMRSQSIWVSMIVYALAPVVAALIQMFNYGLSLTGIAISITTIIIMCTELLDISKQLVEKEKEAADIKISLTLSQIAPHFIYNTLTTIKRLCVTDPLLAQETITNFSNYLRMNLDSMEQKEAIPFNKELEHIKSYVFVEQRRFGDKVKVEYDIKYLNFKVPPLAVQVLAENAIKHGICKKEEGGTVIISTDSDSKNVYVTVMDDGVGFDTENKNIYHIGVKSTIKRLNMMCNGTLTIESEIGKGTRALITIPRKDDNDNTGS